MLEDRLRQEYTEALRLANTDEAMKDKRVLLSFVVGEIEKAKKRDHLEHLDDATLFGMLRKQVKEAQENLAEARKHNHEASQAALVKEITLLETYLPAEMSAEALTALIDTAIVQTGATSMRDVGKVIAHVVSLEPGVNKASLSAQVKAILSQPK